MIKAILFDLDGTLLDTAPDLASTLNELRDQQHLEPLPLEIIRPHVAHGARSLLKIGLNIDEDHPKYTKTLEAYLAIYRHHLTKQTQPFDGILNVLTYLENKQIPWGIVTNKPSRFTFDLLKHLGLLHRAACIICGDTLSKRKPHPDQIIHAASLLQLTPAECLYIGDTQTDVIASKSAGSLSLVTLYGYIDKDDDPLVWKADGYVNHAKEIISWIENRNANLG